MSAVADVMPFIEDVYPLYEKVYERRRFSSKS